MDIHIKTVPHKEQRYNTVGDYWIEDGVIQIRVSEMGNEDYEFLTLDHEIHEIYLCLKRGIKFEDIDKFDMDFEKDRELGLYSFNDEPGDYKEAPYHREHQFASMIEEIVSSELSIDFKDYTDRVIKMTKEYEN